MTRTEITEAELIEAGRLALATMNRLGNLADTLEKFSEKGYASSAQLENAENAAYRAHQIAVELSDKVDAICDYIRRNMEVK